MIRSRSKPRQVVPSADGDELINQKEALSFITNAPDIVKDAITEAKGDRDAAIKTLAVAAVGEAIKAKEGSISPGFITNLYQSMIRKLEHDFVNRKTLDERLAPLETSRPNAEAGPSRPRHLSPRHSPIPEPEPESEPELEPEAEPEAETEPGPEPKSTPDSPPPPPPMTATDDPDPLEQERLELAARFVLPGKYGLGSVVSDKLPFLRMLRDIDAAFPNKFTQRFPIAPTYADVAPLVEDELGADERQVWDELDAELAKHTDKALGYTECANVFAGRKGKKGSHPAYVKIGVWSWWWRELWNISVAEERDFELWRQVFRIERDKMGVLPRAQ